MAVPQVRISSFLSSESVRLTSPLVVKYPVCRNTSRIGTKCGFLSSTVNWSAVLQNFRNALITVAQSFQRSGNFKLMVIPKLGRHTNSAKKNRKGNSQSNASHENPGHLHQKQSLASRRNKALIGRSLADSRHTAAGARPPRYTAEMNVSRCCAQSRWDQRRHVHLSTSERHCEERRMERRAGWMHQGQFLQRRPLQTGFLQHRDKFSSDIRSRCPRGQELPLETSPHRGHEEVPNFSGRGFVKGR